MTDENISLGRKQITDDLSKLLAILPAALSQAIINHPEQGNLIEVVMDFGSAPEARFPVKPSI